ncbi:hypothetical protein [Spiroplasma clarkii]|uniref:hypothetical protein n=1 Tax=Spiroplasma clarkii TaxID=2139 RepID=UPI0011BA7DD3|nr:hypothetical protein [Spiroplasma clarkii]
MAIKLNFDQVIFRVTTTYFVYQILSAIFLQSFVIFMIILTGFNVTIVFVTLLSSFGFIASLPYQFLKIKEEAKVLQFEGSEGAMLLTDVYTAFDLQELIGSKKIKYPNITKFVSDFFVTNEFKTDTFPYQVDKRRDMWVETGILKNTPVTLNFDTTVASITQPQSYGDWKIGDNIAVNIKFNSAFITMAELKARKDENPLIQEFYQYSTDLLTAWGYSIDSDSNDYFELFKNKMPGFYNQLLFIDRTESNFSNLDLLYPEEGIKPIDDNFFNTWVASRFNPALSSPGITFTGVEPLLEKEIADGGFVSLVALFARMFESFLYRHTSNYISATNNPIITSGATWESYISGETCLPQVFISTY